MKQMALGRVVATSNGLHGLNDRAFSIATFKKKRELFTYAATIEHANKPATGFN
jgi:hypothetical protein